MSRRTFTASRCLITGASSGLGRAIAGRLAAEGARIVLTGRSADRLQAVAADLVARGARPEGVIPVAADLTNPEDRRRIFESVERNFGALDLVVNSAGVGAYGHFETHDEAAMRQVFEINFFALAEMTRGALPWLRLGDRPALVNVGSIVARRGLPGRSEYSASKFAVAGFTEAIRAEWTKFGIDVLMVNPGFTATEFDRNLVVDTAIYPTNQRRSMTADAVADATLNALRRGKHEVTLTSAGRLLLLTNRIAPRFVDWGLGRFILKIFPKSPAPTPAEASEAISRPG